MDTAVVDNWKQAGDDFLSGGDIDQAVECYAHGAVDRSTVDDASRRLIQLMRSRDVTPQSLQRILDAVQEPLDAQPEAVLLRTVAAQAAMRLGQKLEAIEEITNACKIRLRQQHPELVDRWTGQPRNPDFLIIGAMKAGTTSLHHYLTQHPQIAGSVQKELWFFNDPTQWAGGIDWYRAHFPCLPSADGFRTGESTPFYLHHAGTAERVRQTVPDARLIVLLRDPVDRIVSDYHFNVGLGIERRGIETALSKEIKRAWWKPHRTNYATRSLYARQLQEWFDWFPQEQFLILDQSELRSDPHSVLDRVFEFLDVSPYRIADASALNRGRYSEIDPILRKRLQKFYRPHNRKLERLLGRKLNWQ